MSSFTTALRSLRGQRAARAVTLVLVVAGVAGVAVSGMPERADVSVDPTVQRDVATWAMPLDGYVLPASELQDQAENLLQEPCLAKAGVQWDVPHRDPDALIALSDRHDTAADANPSPALATTRPLDAALAADRGYHGPSTAGAHDAAWRAWAFDPARNTVDQQVFARCLGAARTTIGWRAALGGGQQTASAAALRLTYVAAVEARSDDTVVRAARTWRTCMVSTGVDDLPGTPVGMPTESMHLALGSDEPDSTVTDVEKRIATKDVSCQVSSGYRRALYDAEWSRLTHVTTTDAAELAHGSEDMAAYGQRLRDLIDHAQR